VRKKSSFALICILVIFTIFIFPSKSSSQEKNSKASSRELIEKVLTDEDLPEGLKKELEKVLKNGDSEGIKEETVKIAPAEKEIPLKAEPFTPPEEEALEEVEPEAAGEEPVEIPPIIEEDVFPPTPEETGKSKELEIYNPTPKRGNTQNVSSAKSNRISLDLKGVDIIDVLKMISTRSNLNIVAGRNVRGKVTLFLKDVDVWDAFEIILAANDLAYEKEGDIINVMTERDYEQIYGDRYYDKKELRIYRLEYAKAAEVIKALNQAKSKIGKVIIDESSNTVVIIDAPKTIAAMEDMIAEMDVPTETKVFGLDYAKAEDVKTKVSEILTKGVGTLQVDERTNKVVITDLSKRMPEIANVIKEMDEKHKEVLIEAKIVQIELSNEFQYGIDWKAVFNKHPSTDGVRFNFDATAATSVFEGTATGGALTIAQFAHSYFTQVIEILQTIGKTNVVSSPRITVLNNEEAKVLVGTNQPYVTTTTTVPGGGSEAITAQNVTYIDVGVQLTVTPTINRDGYVTMKIKPKVSSLSTTPFTAGGNSFPIVSTSETETTVMVKDGNTILIAGLIQDKDQVSESKIPILGDIPIIGNLFKKKTVGSTGTTSAPEKKELVVFLTPYIVQGTEIFPEAENVWYEKKLTQRELLEQQISLAVEDLNKKRSLTEKTPPPTEAEKEKKEKKEEGEERRSSKERGYGTPRSAYSAFNQ
jgi:general secretion pathway protein D